MRYLLALVVMMAGCGDVQHKIICYADDGSVFFQSETATMHKEGNNFVVKDPHVTVISKNCLFKNW